MIINTPIEIIFLDIENELWVGVGDMLVYIKKSPQHISVSLHEAGEEYRVSVFYLPYNQFRYYLDKPCFILAFI